MLCHTFHGIITQLLTRAKQGVNNYVTEEWRKSHEFINIDIDRVSRDIDKFDFPMCIIAIESSDIDKIDRGRC